MIAKHVPMRSVGKSRASTLVSYLMDEQNKLDRVSEVFIGNCQSDDPLVAADEMEATQRRNKRAKGEKTFHLIVSFRAGENPTREAMEDVVKTITSKLGYGAHQWVAVVHRDTDNTHVHLAINKVHPTKHTVHEPHQFQKKLLKLCDQLEDKHGFEKDNHDPKNTAGQNRAADMEHTAGIESLITWIRRECAEDLKAARSWTEFVGVLSYYGLELRERGNGFAMGMVTPEGKPIYPRASNVDRDFSRKALERKFGDWPGADAVPPPQPVPPQPGAGPQPPPVRPQATPTPPGATPQHPHPGAAPPLPQQRPGAGPQQPRTAPNMAPPSGAPRYAVAPVKRLDSSALFARYLEDQRTLDTRRRSGISAEAERLRSEIAQARKVWKAKRVWINLTSHSLLMSRALHGLARKTFEKSLEQARRGHTRRLADLTAVSGRKSWFEWLQAEARKGDQAALAVLRAKTGGTELIAGVPVSHVTKDGAVGYRVGQGAIRDDGRRFTVTVSDPEAIRVALINSMRRTGPTIAATGSDEFKQRLVAVAVASRLPITFSDRDLEARRIAMQESVSVRQPSYQFGSTQPGTAGQHWSAGTGLGQSGRKPERSAGAAVGAGEPDAYVAGSQRREPPAIARHRVRQLSQLGVVQLGRGPELLLPRDVLAQLDKQGAESDPNVRRPVPTAVKPEPAPLTTPAPLDPADRYVDERNRRRLAITDIPAHRRHRTSDAGPLPYAGMRQVEGTALALLRKGDEMLVVPVTAYAANRLKRVSVGTTVYLQKNGQVRTTARSIRR